MEKVRRFFSLCENDCDECQVWIGPLGLCEKHGDILFGQRPLEDAWENS